MLSSRLGRGCCTPRPPIVTNHSQPFTEGPGRIPQVVLLEPQYNTDTRIQMDDPSDFARHDYPLPLS